jgi:uncharacterized membrane protein
MLKKQFVSSSFFIVSVFFLSFFFERWFFFSVFSAFLFGALFLVDAFLFKDRIYHSFLEPTALSGIVQLLPWGAVFWFGVPNISNSTFLIAVVSGIFSMIAMSLYFKAMNMQQDGVLIAILWNLIIVTVPITSHFLFSESLFFSQYFGIALVLVGVTAVIYKRTEVNWNVVIVMIFAVASMTLSVITLKEAYGKLEGGNDLLVFVQGFLPFALGEGIVGICALLFMHSDGRCRTGTLVKRFWYLILLVEGGQVIAQALASYALKTGVASLVVSISGLIGVFVIALAGIILFILEKTPYRTFVEDLQKEQFQNARMKIIGILISAVGAYLIGV